MVGGFVRTAADALLVHGGAVPYTMVGGFRRYMIASGGQDEIGVSFNPGVWRDGFVRDPADDTLCVGVGLVNPTWQGGFLRDPVSGILACAFAPVGGATWQGGFLRAPTGELVVQFT